MRHKIAPNYVSFSKAERCILGDIVSSDYNFSGQHLVIAQEKTEDWLYKMSVKCSLKLLDKRVEFVAMLVNADLSSWRKPNNTAKLISFNFFSS